VPFSDIVVKPRISENSAAELCERRVGDQLIEDVPRYVTREQLLDQPLVAALDEILPRQVADEREDDRQPWNGQRNPDTPREDDDGHNAKNHGKRERHGAGQPRVEIPAGETDDRRRHDRHRECRPRRRARDRSTRQQPVDHIRVYLRAVDVPLGKRRGERFLQSLAAAADDDDPILET
jgi:hypothetical protein